MKAVLRILKIIWYFIKLFLLAMINFIQSFFRIKKVEIKKEEKIIKEKKKRNNIQEESKGNIEPQGLEKKQQNVINQKEKVFNNEIILKEIKKVLKKKEKEISLKTIEKELIPKINEEIEKQKIITQDEFEKEVKKEIENYLKLKEVNKSFIEEKIVKEKAVDLPLLKETISEMKENKISFRNKAEDPSLPIKIETPKETLKEELEIKGEERQKEEVTMESFQDAKVIPPKEVMETLFIETDKYIIERKEQSLENEIIKEEKIVEEKITKEDLKTEEKKERKVEEKCQDFDPLIAKMELETKKTVNLVKIELAKNSLENKLNKEELNILLKKIEEIKIRFGSTLSQSQKEKLKYIENEMSL